MIMRQTGKETLTLMHRYAAGLVAVMLACLVSFPLAAEQGGFAVDPLTGVAMAGYDPVSYFEGEGPQQGSSRFTHEWAGVSWYFASAANREAFARTPAVYAPRFGGYGAMELARGYLSRGNPLVYAIHGDALFLFYSVGNREAFNRSVAPSLVLAAENWPRLAPQQGQRVTFSAEPAAVMQDGAGAD